MWRECWYTVRVGEKGNTIDSMKNEEENVTFIVREFPMWLIPIQTEWRFGKAGMENCELNIEKCELNIEECEWVLRERGDRV